MLARESVQALLDQRLHEGESGTITLARQIRPMQLLIDERHGRRVATEFGLAVVGTGSVLVAAKRIGLIPLVRLLLDELRTVHDFRLGQVIHDVLVREAGEA